MDEFCNDVNDWLTVGGDLDLAQVLTKTSRMDVVESLVAERGVTHVLDLRSEWTDAEVWRTLAPSVVYRHAPITDSYSHFVGESWYTAVEEFVERFWLTTEGSPRMYIHCHMGINRAPSAAMLALLTLDYDLDPFEAFLQVREARPVAGLVYAEQVGRRHLRNLGKPVAEFDAAMKAYWTQDRIRAVNRGIAYFRSEERGTVQAGSLLA